MNRETITAIKERAEELETLADALEKQDNFIKSMPEAEAIEIRLKDRAMTLEIKRAIEGVAKEIAEEIINQNSRGYLQND